MDNDYRSRLRSRRNTKSPNGHNGASVGLSDSFSTPKGEANGTASMRSKRISDNHQRQQLVLWRQPVTTLYYFVLELSVLLRSYGARILHYRKLLVASVVVVAALVGAYNIAGPHQQYVVVFRKQFLWCAYWVGLGILSSVGLGTGLHTFLLYLGPHIAAVTLAAFECLSVDFPEPPYPEDIICPDKEGLSMSIWTIMSKVRLEAFMWGAGTAIGELPPYFMARASRLSGEIDEEERQLEELVKEKDHTSKMSILDRGKITVHNLIQRVGFMGILLCASIPNPLFDLAGITCGHFLVPFSVFFGATLIGKAVIKMHIQKMFVIFLFSEHHVEEVVKLIKYIPYFGASLQAPFKEYLKQQKAKLHHKPGTQLPSESSWLSWIFEKVVAVMVVYFVVSIIHSLAHNYHKRLTSENKTPTAPPSEVTQSKRRKK